jgi:hypothetical protein
MHGYVHGCKQTYFILITPIACKCGYHAHFTEGETETKKDNLPKVT